MHQFQSNFEIQLMPGAAPGSKSIHQNSDTKLIKLLGNL
jgi:hypothetical protein